MSQRMLFRWIAFLVAIPCVRGALPFALAQEVNRSASSTQHSESVQAKEKISFGQVKPLMVKRVGVDEKNLWYLSLHDAILKALENNNEIQVQRHTVRINELAIKALKGTYDPVLFVGNPAPATAGAAGGPISSLAAPSGPGLGFESRSLPVASRLQAGRDSNAQTSRTFSYNVGVGQALPTGGSWQLALSNQRVTTNSVFATLNPQYATTLTIEVTQPLVRNFRLPPTEQQIRIAKKTLDLSDSQFRQRVIEIITQVQKAYFDLVFAIRNVEIMQESVELAKVQHQNNLQQVEAGTLAPLELHQSTAEIERRQQDLILAIAQVTTAENALKGLILPHLNDDLWRANIVPTENIEFLPPAVDEESALRLALQNRPELEQIRLQKEQNEVNLEYFANQTRPQVNLVARYASFGIAGLEVPPDPRFPFGAGAVPAEFLGGPATALGNAFRQRYRNVAVGVSFSLPLRNQTAQANLGQAKARARILDFQEQQVVQQIAIEIRNAVQNVLAARQSIEAARAARLAREKQLEGEQLRFEAGITTNYLVLQYQNQLSWARGAELQALVTYNKAIAELQRVMATTLTTHNIQISSLPAEAKSSR